MITLSASLVFVVLGTISLLRRDAPVTLWRIVLMALVSFAASPESGGEVASLKKRVHALCGGGDAGPDVTAVDVVGTCVARFSN